MIRSAVLLGVVGFLCGFIGPIVLAPDANQGPLLGIFITGPAGVLLGAVLGAIGGLLGWPPAIRWKVLSGAAILVGVVTLYFCVPKPFYVADLIEGEVRSCVDAVSLRAKTIARLDAMEASRPHRQSVQWAEKFDQSLGERPGAVIDVHVLRVKQVFEKRARWNRGDLVAQPWVAADRNTSYFLDRPEGGCGALSGERGIYEITGATDRWRPYGIAEILGVRRAEPMPAKYGSLAQGR